MFINGGGGRGGYAMDLWISGGGKEERGGWKRRRVGREEMEGEGGGGGRVWVFWVDELSGSMFGNLKLF